MYKLGSTQNNTPPRISPGQGKVLFYQKLSKTTEKGLFRQNISNIGIIWKFIPMNFYGEGLHGRGIFCEIAMFLQQKREFVV